MFNLIIRKKLWEKAKAYFKESKIMSVLGLQSFTLIIAITNSTRTMIHPQQIYIRTTIKALTI